MILLNNDFYLKKSSSGINTNEDLNSIDTISDLQNLLNNCKSEENFMNDNNDNDNLLFLHKILELVYTQEEFDWQKWKIANILFNTLCPQIAFTYDKNHLKPNEIIADFDIVEIMGKIFVVIPENSICIDTKMTLHGTNEAIDKYCISQALKTFEEKCAS
ncbi:hypothetical protein [Succinatimonas hippei]|uniref:Uncharacterized protein n=1 Tax=Succinatimonas hippei (strain DSM 22608 / JCM 16073 / KCTC 15190 / YIT 12066) TaxID=762983 RepID=E8LMB9_SUCHY|nr:hypothetical protein [Succinatimonas hippei]EFY06331.1 hypothetical protein HMPREF9444_01905 [Succinatimonas hippei YIT 12066]